MEIEVPVTEAIEREGGRERDLRFERERSELRKTESTKTVLCVRVEGELITFYRCISFRSLLFVEICWALFVSTTTLGRVWLLQSSVSMFRFFRFFLVWLR